MSKKVKAFFINYFFLLFLLLVNNLKQLNEVFSLIFQTQPNLETYLIQTLNLKLQKIQ
jgi:hypothetical protein